MNRDRALAWLAARQHDAVARVQLLALGLTAKQIRGRVRRGVLDPMYRGVYLTGTPTLRGRWMAAVLAAGPGAVLSHHDAAALHELRAAGGAGIAVAVPRRRERSGLVVHRTLLADDEMTVVDRIPVTTVSRTLLDLAGVLAPRPLERALVEAERRRLGDPVGLRALLDRHPRAKGANTLRALLAGAANLHSWTRSELEEAFVLYVRRYDLPEGEANGHVDGVGECDMVWRDQRVVVELDSREWHDDRLSFAADRAKARRLTAAGWPCVRVAPEHLATGELADDLGRLLDQVPRSSVTPR